MVCDTQPLKGQTLTQRKEQVRAIAAAVSAALAAGKIKAVVGPQGAVAFEGLTAQDRGSVSDACIYRRVMATGSPLAKAKIQAAELLSGRSVSKQAVAAGTHSHDGGRTWHKGH